MSVLRDLLRIKTFRENKAEMEVRRQRAALAEAAARRKAALQRRDEFHDHAVRKERTLYDELCTRTVRLREIQDVQDTVAELRVQEQGYEQALGTAIDRESAESVELDACKDRHQQASRLKEKFVELARASDDELARELERKEDAELEEVAELRRDRAEMDAYQENPS